MSNENETSIPPAIQWLCDTFNPSPPTTDTCLSEGPYDALIAAINATPGDSTQEDGIQIGSFWWVTSLDHYSIIAFDVSGDRFTFCRGLPTWFEEILSTPPATIYTWME